MAQKLLVIDPNSRVLNLVGDFLSNLGYEVHRASEPDEAAALLKNYRYAFIITGEELSSFGAPAHNLAQFVDTLVPKPHIVRMQETKTSPPLHVDQSALVIEKPVSLLQLGDLIRETIIA